MESQPIDTLDGLIKQLEGLDRDLKINPPVIVNFAMYGNEPPYDTITINVNDNER